MTFQQLLAWLSTTEGLSAVLGFLWSWLVEYIPGFSRLSPVWKRLVVMVTSILIAVLVAAVRAWLGYAPWSFEQTFWPAIWMGGSVAYGFSQVAHMRELRAQNG